MKIYKYCLLAFLWPLMNSIAQSTPQQIKPLTIGDNVPYIKLDSIVNYSIPIAALADFKNKLVILDFWATWCAPCVKSLPEFQAMQLEFKGDLQFLLTTPQDGKLIADFLKSRNIELPSLVGENYLGKLFTHNSVPHEVWIKEGKVVAITHFNEVTRGNIKGILSGEITRLPEKKDNMDYDLNLPLLANGNGGTANNLLTQSIITNYLDGVSGGGGVSTDSMGRYKIRAINASVVRLYQTAAQQADLYLSLDNRHLLPVKNKEKLLPQQDPEFEPGIRGDFYCYELIIPPTEKPKAGRFMLADLNRFFGPAYHVRGEVKKQQVICWVLKKKDSISRAATKGGTPKITDEDDYTSWQNQPFANFFFALSYINRKQPFPFVDKTGIKVNVDIRFPLKATAIPGLNVELAKYGLEFIKEACDVEMLVLKNI